MTTAAVPTASVAAVVGDNCDNGNNGSGVDGGGDDSGCGDSKCDGSSRWVHALVDQKVMLLTSS